MIRPPGAATAAALLATAVMALAPRLAVAAQWGSAYGDPPGFCPAQSWLPWTYRSLVTSDPLVGNNPEQDTFFGYHAWPGYDDWYGYWYGDFRGRPGDASGWQLITTVNYPDHAHWNFPSWGWAVHGHAKQYIAYYNWTFAGQCGLGWGAGWPAPYMADVDGVPVLDVYVDSVPPAVPQPRISAVSTSSVSFTWNPVSDQGDGSGADWFAVGMRGYTSWLTVNGGPPVGRQDSAGPLVLTSSATTADTVCAYASASDQLGNASAAGSACGRPVGPPPAPPPPPPASVQANPMPGLAGLPAWFWLTPSPAPLTTRESVGGVSYRIVATPVTADWDFGDGRTLAAAAFGSAYPAVSAIQHAYDAQSLAGYPVAATVNYSLTWEWQSGSNWVGPYPMPGQAVPASGALYPVEQAQPELEMGFVS